ncbi:hypothetical protein GOV07_01835 [Candidatus Woesearchaeota archaeon]|nr:hypothetical protein [Candidatus Woesearchaeota archaeon]
MADTYLLLDRQQTDAQSVPEKIRPFFTPPTGAQLRGVRMYRQRITGVADSIQAVQEADLARVASFLLLHGRSLVPEEVTSWQESPEWNSWDDMNHERLVLKDTKGVYGVRNAHMVVDLVNAPYFSDDHERIRAAVQDGALVRGALQFNRSNRKERNALNRLLYEGVVGDCVLGNRFFTSVGDFEDASQGFVLDGDLAYAVVRPAVEALENSPSGYHLIDHNPETEDQSSQRDVDGRVNPDLSIATGGVKPAHALLNRAKKFGFTQYGSWHDGYQLPDSGRLGVAGGSSLGVYFVSGLGNDGASVGVAPEALDAFFKGLRDSNLERRVE